MKQYNIPSKEELDIIKRDKMINEDGIIKHKELGVNESIAKEILDRAEHGLKKYGMKVDDNPLNLNQWFTHHSEELMDALVYLERSKREAKMLMEKLLKLKQSYPEIYNEIGFPY